VEGWIYWHAAGTWSPYHCFYGDANCSLTFATYLLCFLTGFAFLAAFYAARIAIRSYLMEQSTILTERNCPDSDHPAHVSLTVTDQLAFQEWAPDPDEQTFSYIPFDYDFENLGRSPIIDACVDAQFESDGTRVRKTVSLGSIRRDGHVHVRVYIWTAYIRGRLRWLKKGARHWEISKSVPLDFRPSQTWRVDYLAAAPLTATQGAIEEPPIRVPVQPPHAGG
jgi:hypothetical protein